jgi:uncharacterized protein YhfF
MRNTLTAALFYDHNSCSKPKVTGKWKTIDDQTGEAKSIIEIYEKGGKVYGKVVDILALLKKDVCKTVLKIK